MTATRGDVYYDPYDPEIYRNPYPALARLREEAPLYYNDAYDFYAVSRYADVEEAYRNKETFISSRGDMLEMIKSDLDLPPGSLIFEDPPIHTAHRGLMSRVFTPKKMLALVPKMREYCASCLDPLIGVDGFDFIADLAAEMPMKVIGMLLGIPESDQAKVRDYAEANLVVEPGHAVEYSEDYFIWGTDVRGVHRLEDEAPFGRSDDRATQRRVRRRNRRYSDPDQGRGPHVYQHRGQRR